MLGNRIVFGSVNSALQDFRSGLGHLSEIRARWPNVPGMLVTRRIPLHEVPDVLTGGRGDIKVVVDASA